MSFPTHCSQKFPLMPLSMRLGMRHHRGYPNICIALHLFFWKGILYQGSEPYSAWSEGEQNGVCSFLGWGNVDNDRNNAQKARTVKAIQKNKKKHAGEWIQTVISVCLKCGLNDSWVIQHFCSVQSFPCILWNISLSLVYQNYFFSQGIAFGIGQLLSFDEDLKVTSLGSMRILAHSSHFFGINRSRCWSKVCDHKWGGAWAQSAQWNI